MCASDYDYELLHIQSMSSNKACADDALPNKLFGSLSVPHAHIRVMRACDRVSERDEGNLPFNIMYEAFVSRMTTSMLDHVHVTSSPDTHNQNISF